MIHENILFIHIPKTGGTSVREFLNQNNLESWKRDPLFTFHDPLFLLEQYNDLSQAIKITIVRNPYKRAFSHYKHIQKVKNFNKTFNEFLNYIRINGHIWLMGASYNSQITFNHNFPLISFTQSFYLYDENGNICIDKVYRTEKLNEFENDFNTTLSNVNKGSYFEQEYLKAYDETNKTLVKNLFMEDFLNFSYSVHFDDSAN